MEADFVKTDLPNCLKVPQVAGSKGIYLTFSPWPSCRSGLCLQNGCMSVEVIKSLLNILALELECPGSGPCHLKGPLSFVELLKMILQTWATKQLLLASVWPCFVFSKHCANFFFSFIWSGLPNPSFDHLPEPVDTPELHKIYRGERPGAVHI